LFTHCHKKSEVNVIFALQCVLATHVCFLHDCAFVVIEHRPYKLNLTEAPQNSTVMVGQNVSLYCGVVSGHPSVKWFKGNINAHGNVEVCEFSQFMYCMPDG
jgi:hypothetical protein